MSDDSDIPEYTRRGAVGLMGVGGALAVTETFGFTQLTADRGVGITVSGDDASGFEITTADGSGLNDTTSANQTLSLTFRNNTGTDFDGNSLSENEGLAVEISASGTDVEVTDRSGDQSFSSTSTTISSGSSGTVATDLPSSDTAKLDIENTTDDTDATVDLHIVATDSNNEIRINIDTEVSSRKSITVSGPSNSTN